MTSTARQLAQLEILLRPDPLRPLDHSGASLLAHLLAHAADLTPTDIALLRRWCRSTAQAWGRKYWTPPPGHAEIRDLLAVIEDGGTITTGMLVQAR